MASTLGFARLILACATRVISGAAPNSAIRAGAGCACSAVPAITMPRAVARKICAFMGFFLNVADRMLRDGPPRTDQYAPARARREESHSWDDVSATSASAAFALMALRLVLALFR